MAGWFYRAMHKEPVVMWSCAIGGLGLVMPLIVPRGGGGGVVADFVGGGETAAVKAPPSAAAVVRALRPSA